MTNGEFHADAIRGIVTETERNTLDRVLEIIDKKHNGIYNHDFMTDSKTAGARMKLLEQLRKEVADLKGGEAE